jgi:TonB family protein
MRRSLVLAIGVLAVGGTVQAEEKEPPITAEGGRGVFLRGAHEAVHPTWAARLLRNAGERLPAGHPLNDRSLSAVIEVVVMADGTITDARIERSSGSREFDAAALGVFVMGDQLPAPPDDMLSDDNRAHLLWTLARDRRACSGVTLLAREDSLERALPLLLSKRRDREAVRRVRAAALADPDAAIGALARFWLERAYEQSAQPLPAALGLAALGDPRGAEVLREALARAERVPEVSAALGHLGLLGRPAAAPPPPPPTEALVRALHRGDRAARVAAAVVLAARSDEAARRPSVSSRGRATPSCASWGRRSSMAVGGRPPSPPSATTARRPSGRWPRGPVAGWRASGCWPSWRSSPRGRRARCWRPGSGAAARRRAPRYPRIPPEDPGLVALDRRS